MYTIETNKIVFDMTNMLYTINALKTNSLVLCQVKVICEQLIQLISAMNGYFSAFM